MRIICASLNPARAIEVQPPRLSECPPKSSASLPMREACRFTIIERRRAVTKGTWIFHLDGEQIGDFRKAWQRACVLTGLGTFYCRECHVKLDAKCQCPKCEWKWDGQDVAPVYRGKLFHDFRRTAVRDMRRRGADPDVIRSLTGHETLSMLSRYNITDDRDQRAALRTMHAYRQEQDAAPRSLATMPASSKGIN